MDGKSKMTKYVGNVKLYGYTTQLHCLGPQMKTVFHK